MSITHKGLSLSPAHVKRNKLIKNSSRELHFNCLFLTSNRVSFLSRQRAIKTRASERNWSRKFFVFNFGELLPLYVTMTKPASRKRELCILQLIRLLLLLLNAKVRQVYEQNILVNALALRVARFELPRIP
jgi:hypothetical protein